MSVDLELEKLARVKFSNAGWNCGVIKTLAYFGNQFKPSALSGTQVTKPFTKPIVVFPDHLAVLRCRQTLNRMGLAHRSAKVVFEGIISPTLCFIVAYRYR